MSYKAPSLAEVQAAFTDAIVSESESALKRFLPFIQESPQGPKAADRFKVYADAWSIRLEESLREDYSLLQAALGSKKWNQLVSSYIRLCPSTSFTLAHAGDRLPEFLEEHFHSIKPWLPDLAKLERALYRLNATRDPVPWSPEELKLFSDHDAEKVYLRFQPGVQLLETSWNVECCLEDDVEPEKVSQRGLLVFRDAQEDLLPTAERLDENEFRLLKMIGNGVTLIELVDALNDDQWLPNLIQRASEGVVRVTTK